MQPTKKNYFYNLFIKTTIEIIKIFISFLLKQLYLLNFI